MLLAVDIGNTRTTYGAYDGDQLLRTFSHETLKEGGNVGPDFFREMTQIARPDVVGIASVVPEVTKKTALFIDAVLGKVPIRIIGNNDVPMANHYADAFAVGTDRLIASYAAYERYGRTEKKPIIVIDFGTATTYDCITTNGDYLGGAITLGIASSVEALSALASQLPEVPLEFPEHVVANSTVHSIQSGILFGALAQAEGMISRITKEVFPNDAPIVVATGGLAKLLEGKTEAIHRYDSQLVLDGIRTILSDSEGSLNLLQPAAI
jgi:type III pantothenate kinase